MSFLKSPAGTDPVIVEGLFRAPVARVYRAWTDPAQLVAWFGPAPKAMVSAEADVRVGGRAGARAIG